MKPLAEPQNESRFTGWTNAAMGSVNAFRRHLARSPEKQDRSPGIGWRGGAFEDVEDLKDLYIK